jgi:hypothetical protein
MMARCALEHQRGVCQIHERIFFTDQPPVFVEKKKIPAGKPTGREMMEEGRCKERNGSVRT